MNVEQIYAAEADRLRQGLKEWADEGLLPADRSAALAAIVRRTMAENETPPGLVRHRSRLHWAVGVAAALVALLLVPFAWSPARAWATDTFPALARFLGLKAQEEPGWAWALEHDALQEVLAEAEDRGYTFRVHRVLADPTQTAIVYSVEGPSPDAPDFWAGELDAFRFNGQRFVTHGGGSGRLMDDLYVGVEEVSPLPAESGTLTIDLQAIGEVRGRWVVSFPVTRQPLTELARTIPVGQAIDLDGAQLAVEKVEVLPTQTVVSLRYAGPRPAPILKDVELTTQSGAAVAPRGAWGDGDGAFEYRLRFQPLPEGTTAFTLRVRSLETVQRDQRLTLPLAVGETARVGDRPQVTVVAVHPDRAVLQWGHDTEETIAYEGWWVVDELGVAHRAGRYGGTGNWTADGADTAQSHAAPDQDLNNTTTLVVTWDDALPRGRTPVALEAREVWHRVEGNWEFTIPLQ